MKTDNELIAEFMGVKVSPTGCTMYDENKRKIVNVDDLEYDSSWDALMPVVEKIKQLQDKIHFDERGLELIKTIEKYICLVQIKDSHMYVAEFIKWHNENTSR